MKYAPSSPSTVSESSIQELLEPDLSDVIPPVAILPAHFSEDELHHLEDTLHHYGAPLTTDVSRAKVFIGKVGTKRRAEFEMRSRKIKVEEASEKKRMASPTTEEEPVHKKRRVNGTSDRNVSVENGGTNQGDSSDGTVDEDTGNESVVLPKQKKGALSLSHEKFDEHHSILPHVFCNPSNDDVIWVVKVDWLDACISAKRLLPLQDYLVYKGKVLERPASQKPNIKEAFSRAPGPHITPASQIAMATRPNTVQSILERAKADAAGVPLRSRQPYRPGGHSQTSNRFADRAFAPQSQKPGLPKAQVVHLLQQTTSEYEGQDSDFPAPPEWVIKGIKYSCQRMTPPDPANDAFIRELKKIRKARILIDDEIGVRAYSTSIAAIAAYPYPFIHPRQILQLPGCDTKVASLWVEWTNTGRIQAVQEFENDEAMKVLSTFWEIWGVGAKTARQFYYHNHWTELDDLIEFGWNNLDRVQQIGLKYYEEFLDPIPRIEVERIAEVVRQHAIRVRDDRVTVTVVGSYRRGKLTSGDVDMIVSHPDLNATADMVSDIVESLDAEGWITHTLLLSTNSTQRGQATLPFRTSRAGGPPGFDTLDKALVVWQDINWPTKEADLAADPDMKNPNPHRRVDIIISPWRTVGCAVMGWSGGTTFQRDLRRYAKNVKGWKFDSSGIRSRVTGEVVALEGPEGIKGTPEEAERKVFEGLGLDYVPPDMRHTG
ncbi:Nucleotidyltransferase [Delitschia confertaspora ATCC 74209]|uniref:DNA polymerase lambda n=1 Tax=Delitschia confertaspora ATCC 74209 TaxID=1513339 RepID=A0A9P4JXB7_9PLEO|nr:Nucleotidyltransferase [Delitschia confertaspora ATCC 74209]